MSYAAFPRILVAGMGNVFLGDDAFGCEVTRALCDFKLPGDTQVVDFGIRGLDLAYSLLDPYRTIILIDAVVRGGSPGTIYLLQPADDPGERDDALDPHAMDPIHLMAMARSLGEITATIFIVGCEPCDFGDALEGRMGLSAIVSASIPEAVRTVMDLLQHPLQPVFQEPQESVLCATTRIQEDR